MSGSATIKAPRLQFDLELNFEKRELQGWVEHELDAPAKAGQTLQLHMRDLFIESVRSADSSRPHHIRPGTEPEGSLLQVELTEGDKTIRIHYRTSPAATGLQWLNPGQTAGKTQPFVYSQGQTIHTRSWLPCIDEPTHRVRFEGVLRNNRGLRAVMAAEDCSDPKEIGVFRFRLNEPVPTYLIAFAVGNLVFEATGTRSGVWTEPETLAAASYEFAETESMIQAAEKLFGAYRWGRYDLLVLPPSFPLGGMENPRLTFVTPTVLAGDRSLVSLVAHELAHSWSGNLVTNSSWDDFWLNEGFTVYLERRIIEEIYGRERSEMEAVLGRSRLEATLAQLPVDSRDSWLKGELAQRHPDDAITDIPYEKGYLFLRRIEEIIGRSKLDGFLQGYFDKYAFETMDTERFVEELKNNLFADHPDLADRLRHDVWIYGPGIPDDAPRAQSDAFAAVETTAAQVADGASINRSHESWSTHEWIHFLRQLPRDLSPGLLDELGRDMGFDAQHNAEIRCEWLKLCVETGRPGQEATLREFLVGIGRRKFLQPIYDALQKTPEGTALAKSIYAQARDGYHSFVRSSFDEKLAG